MPDLEKDETEEQLDQILERIQLWLESSDNEDTKIPMSWLNNLLSSCPELVALVDEEGKPKS